MRHSPPTPLLGFRVSGLFQNRRQERPRSITLTVLSKALVADVCAQLLNDTSSQKSNFPFGKPRAPKGFQRFCLSTLPASIKEVLSPHRRKPPSGNPYQKGHGALGSDSGGSSGSDGGFCPHAQLGSAPSPAMSTATALLVPLRP